MANLQTNPKTAEPAMCSMPSTSADSSVHPPKCNSELGSQYEELFLHISDTEEPVKSQILKIISPLRVHIYKVLLEMNKSHEAQIFLKYTSKLLTRAEKDKLSELSLIKTAVEFESHEYFKKFCKMKCIARLSKEAYSIFINYLKEKDMKEILRIFIENFNILQGSDVISLNCSFLNMMDSTSQKPNEAHCSRDEPSQSNTEQSATENSAEEIVFEMKKHCCIYNIDCRNQNICSVDMNCTNTFLASGFENASIHLWKLNLDTFKQMKHIKLGLIAPRDFTSHKKLKMSSCHGSDVMLRGHKGSIYGLCFTPQHNLLLSCSEDCSVKAWCLKDFKNVASWCDQKYPIWDVAVSCNTQYFATASRYLAELWCFERSSSVRMFVENDGDVGCVRIHPNCKYVATASENKTIKLWDLQHGRPVRTFNAEDFISCIEFSPCGKQLVSADDFGNIKIWDLASGKMLQSLSGAHTARILSVAYSQSGKLVASGGYDEILKIWDVDNNTDILRNRQEPVEMQVTRDNAVQYVSFRNNNLLVSLTSPKRHNMDGVVQII